jgi:threonyl-tRNA synthetase
MIHRVILGALERFIGVLIEHYAGAFPTWLAPVQAVVMTVTDRGAAYAEEVLVRLKGAGIRAEGDFRNEKLGLKVREAQLQKIPYMLIVGDKEVEERGITPRLRSGQNLPLMSPEAFVELIEEECRQRRESL